MPLPFIAAAAVPAILSFVLRALVVNLIFRVITSLGVAIISFSAIDTVAGTVTAYVQSALNAVNGDVYQVADMLGFFDCINIVLSAYLAAISIRQLRGLYNKLTFGKTV